MKGVVMFTRQGRHKTITVQAVVYSVALFLSINLLTVKMASSEDTVVDNHPGIQGDSWKPTHEENLHPLRSMNDLLRNGMGKDRISPRLRDEYLRYSMKRKDKKAGLENPQHPSSEEEATGKGVEGAKAATLLWELESLDTPKTFLLLLQGSLPSMQATIPILLMVMTTCIMHTTMAPHGITRRLTRH